MNPDGSFSALDRLSSKSSGDRDESDFGSEGSCDSGVSEEQEESEGMYRVPRRISIDNYHRGLRWRPEAAVRESERKRQ